MKPTSIIFLILAAILIVSGIAVCIVGGVMASAQDINLLGDSTDAEGNDITTHSLEEYSLTDININIKDADVNIIGQSVKSYIEFKNINFATYDLSINKKKLDLESVNPFDISSIIKFRENGGGFKGLRHYLYLNKYSDDISEVNIYITPGQSLDEIGITVKNGDITIKNMSGDTLYDLSTENGNVIIENSKTNEDIAVKAVKGNFTFDRSNAGHLSFTVNNGNGKFIADRQFYYDCQCEKGKIYLDDENIGDSYQKVYPETQAEEGEEVVIPGNIKGSVTSGDLVIDIAE